MPKWRCICIQKTAASCDKCDCFLHKDCISIRLLEFWGGCWIHGALNCDPIHDYDWCFALNWMKTKIFRSSSFHDWGCMRNDVVRCQCIFLLDSQFTMSHTILHTNCLWSWCPIVMFSFPRALELHSFYKFVRAQGRCLGILHSNVAFSVTDCICLAQY